MSILEKSWEDLERELQPKDAFKDLTHEEAIALCRQFAGRIREMSQTIAELSAQNSKLGWEREYYVRQFWDREQAERSAQGIFG